MTCETCEGKGYVYENYYLGHGNYDIETTDCPDCGGTGEVDKEGDDSE